MHSITYNGKEYRSQSALAKEYGISTEAFRGRLKRGWSIEKALNIDVGTAPQKAEPNVNQIIREVLKGFDGKYVNSIAILNDDRTPKMTRQQIASRLASMAARGFIESMGRGRDRMYRSIETKPHFSYQQQLINKSFSG